MIADKVTRKLEFAGHVPSGPHGMALAIAHQVSADALEMYLDIVNDPPAPYDTVAQPQFDVPEASTGDPQIDGLMLDLAQMTGYGAAGLKAYERYQQAATDDSAAGVHRQAAAMGRFDGAARGGAVVGGGGPRRMGRHAGGGPEVGGIDGHAGAGRPAGPIFARVRQDGLDAGERQGFADAGMSDAAIAKLTAELAANDLEDVVVGVPVEDLLRTLADELRAQAPAFDAIASEAEAVAQSTDTPPVASFDATPASGAPPLQVTFRDTSVHPDDEPLTVTWDFGDGSPAAEGAQVTHTFNAGTFEVTQTVFDGVSTSTATRTIVATPPNGAPTARIVRTPAEGDAPLSVSFDGSTSTDDGAIMAYEWAFGDGGIAQGQTAAHDYATPGTYTATLTVTDDGGKTGVAVATVVVREPSPDQPPVAVADQLTTRQDTARTIDVLANDSDPEGGALTLVDTGTPAHGTASCTDRSCTYTPAAGYAGPDAFTYVVEDPAGGRATGQVTVTVNDVNDPPTAKAGADQDVLEDDGVFLDAQASADPDGSIVSYTWDFGDGSDPVRARAPGRSTRTGCTAATRCGSS